MAVVTKVFPIAVDKMVRLRDGGPNAGNGKDNHLIIGRHAGAGVDYQHRAYLRFTLDWTGVQQIVKADLKLTTSSQVHVTFGTSPLIQVQRLQSQAIVEGNAGEGPVWDPTEYQAIPRNNAGLTSGPAPKTEQTAFRIDITDIVEAWAPVSVQKRNGGQGGALPNIGIGLYGKPETALSALTEVYSEGHATAGFHPAIELTYEQGNTAPLRVENATPEAAVTSAANFQGDFIDPGDFLSATNIQIIDRNTNGPVIWETTQPASASERDANRFSVPIPALIKSGVEYEWRARVADSKGVYGPWNYGPTGPYQWFKITNDPPTLVLQSLGSYASLSATHFRGAFSDPNSGDRLGSFRIQFRPQTAPGHSDWDLTNHLWDTGPLIPTLNEQDRALFDRSYGGAPLTAGTYTWRAQVADNWGAWSPWVYDDIVLTDDWSPDPGLIDFLTTFSPKKTPCRVVIRRMGIDPTFGGRGPALDPADLSKFATPLAIIDDATNIGASQYLNSAGEFYMTLPATHPQVSVIEPYQVHYAVELYNGDRWREVFAGLITDFDATADDVVFYGIDYLGLLSLSIDDRYDKTAPDKPHSQGGSKYVDQTISTVILDQLNTARAQSDSPVGFISIAAGSDVFSERVTIFSTFTQRLGFIAGLIDSHRQGTGKRSRLQVRRKTSAAYEFVLQDDPGKDRENLQMEYGGLVQGFRLTAFGDFGTYVHGLGRTKTGTAVMYHSEAAVGIPTNTWGRIAKARVWPDLIDENDLIRRVKQTAASVSKIGKRIALAIKTDAVQPFDGYDITDNIPVHIVRGVVDTDRYGSGLWSVLGVEMRVTPLGALDNTFVLLPKEDGVAPDPDLIPSNEILSDQAQWEVSTGAPIDGVNLSEFFLDSSTGQVYQNVGGHWVKVPLNADSLSPGVVDDESINPGGLNADNITTGTLPSEVDLDASAINDGTLPGGHNAILNSSFELADFGAVASVAHTWTVAADWTATRVGSDTNVTTGAGALTETGMTY